jgi:hypothetical protein
MTATSQKHAVPEETVQHLIHINHAAHNNNAIAAPAQQPGFLRRNGELMTLEQQILLIS